MAASPTTKAAATGANNPGTNTQATSSVAFANGHLYAVWVAIRAATAPTVSSITGGGITWVLVKRSNAAGNTTLELWCGFVTSGASTGALTITMTGNPNRSGYIIDDIGVGTNATAGQNGLDAFRTPIDTSGTNTAGTATVAAFDDATRNIAYGAFMHLTMEATTQEATYTQLGTTQSNNSTNAMALASEFKTGQDTTISSSWTTSSVYRGIGVEIIGSIRGVAAIAGGGVLSANGVRTRLGSAAIAGAGVLAASGVASHLAAAAIAGAGALSANGKRTGVAAAAIAGAGALSATGKRTGVASAAIAGGGILAANGTRISSSGAAVAGAGALSATGSRTTFGSSAIAGAGLIEALGALTRLGAAEILGAGQIDADGIITRVYPAIELGDAEGRSGSLDARGRAAGLGARGREAVLS